MATQVQDHDCAWLGRSGVWVTAEQDSSTTRADFEQDRVMQGEKSDWFLHFLNFEVLFCEMSVKFLTVKNENF